MSLKYILQEWSKETSQPVSSVNQRANALDKINKAANELWDSTDLPGSLREQVFDVDYTLKEVTLPYYVDKIRGVRHYNSRGRIKQNDMRPHYQHGNWTQELLSWRVKQVLALGHSITNEAPLTIQLSAATTVAFNLYIKMSTSTKSSVVEQIPITVGPTQFVTVNAPTSFPGVLNIEKDALTDVDVRVIDASGVVVAEIPNNERASRYTLIQVVDENIVYVQIDPCYEILYKIRFTPFVNDYDVYPVDGYDDAVVWKAVSNFWKKKPNSGEQVGMAEGTLDKILSQKAANAEAGEELELGFAFNRFNDIMAGGFATGLYNDFPYRSI